MLSLAHLPMLALAQPEGACTEILRGEGMLFLFLFLQFSQALEASAVSFLSPWYHAWRTVSTGWTMNGGTEWPLWLAL